MAQIIFFLVFSVIFAVIAGRIIANIRKKGKKESGTEGKGPKSIGLYEQSEVKEEAASILEDKLWYQEESAFLSRLNEAIAFTLEKNLIATSIVDEVYSFLNVSNCMIFLSDRESSRLDLEYAKGKDESMLKSFFLQARESITGYVASSREPIIVNDLPDNYYYGSLNKEAYFVKSLMSIPMCLKNETIGVINVTDKKTGKPFSQREFEFLQNVARIAAIAFKNANLRAQIQEDYLRTITMLALIIDARDPYTQRHSFNVTRYSVAIAKQLGLTPDQIDMIRRAASLHDIGKIGVRDDVLLKQGALTKEEFEQIKTHSIKGEEIVRSLPFLRNVATIVRQHHERFDGKGYPDGKKGEEINLGARILAVADTFDSMTTDRPYRKSLPLQTAIDELLKNRDSQFDPRLVDSFINVLNEKEKDFNRI